MPLSALDSPRRPPIQLRPKRLASEGQRCVSEVRTAESSRGRGAAAALSAAPARSEEAEEGRPRCGVAGPAADVELCPRREAKEPVAEPERERPLGGGGGTTASGDPLMPLPPPTPPRSPACGRGGLGVHTFWAP